ncbi:MAG: hypothetical protein SGJ20_15205 [Planctomycetota bacterium]|nr:hypothetical protein [Planctomycetota bacterium]
MRVHVATALLGCLISLNFVSPTRAVIVLSGNEVWDGIQNPHSAEGVTLLNNVYTIPDELILGSNSIIALQAPFSGNVSPSITFQFTGSGGLKFTDNTSIIDTFLGGRYAAPATFTLNMGSNPINVLNPGAGRIINGISVIDGGTGDSMNVAINSNSDVTLGEIDIKRIDSRAAGINVTAGGNVNIGRLANPDTNSGGDNVLDVNVTARSITLGDIDTRAFRPDGIRRNGDINLKALAPPSFDPTNFAGNLAAQNVITLNGAVNTNGPPVNNAAGNLNLTAVKVVLGNTFTANISENADFNVTAGNISGAFTQANLFMNASSVTPDTLQFSVYHDNELPTSITWKNNISGNWHDTNNWNPAAIPNVNQQTAVFGSVIASPRTIFLDQGATVKGLQFSTTSKVAVAGTAGLTLDAATGNASILVQQGSHEVQVALTLNDNLDITTTTSASRRIDLNGAVNLNGKTITVAGPGIVNINNRVTGGGSIINSGGLGTAGSTGLDGSLTSTGTLAINVAGTAVNSYDAWNVTGSATLSGILSVDAISGFTPTGGQLFTVLTAGSVSAASLTLGGPDAALFNLIISPTSLVLQAIGAGLAGDYNHNGVVDSGDYVVWRHTKNQSVTPGTGADGDGSGVVDDGDYTYWRARFGNTATGSALASSTNVPEPASGVLAVVTLLGFTLIKFDRRVRG